MPDTPDCIFCQIVRGDAPCSKVWEDAEHLAFLSIFPNTEGFTVVITKDHHSSYLFDNPREVIDGIVHAAQQVARVLDSTFEDVGRTGLMFEGFGVNHLHAKLFPMHGTKTDEWQSWQSKVDKYFDRYEGYMSTHNYKRAEDATLDTLARRLRGE